MSVETAPDCLPATPAKAHPVHKLIALYGHGCTWLQKLGEPVFLLWLRVYIGWAFFASGLSKFKGGVDGTADLFRYVHPVPGLDPVFAAYSSMAVELLAPLFIFAGLLTRLAAVPLLVTALVIQYIVGADEPSFMRWEHILWITVLVTLILRGGGVLSADTWLARYYQQKVKPDQTS